MLAVADISAHLAQLCHLYEGTSPAISQLYAELAPLSPESLPGAGPPICACMTQRLPSAAGQRSIAGAASPLLQLGPQGMQTMHALH